MRVEHAGSQRAAIDAVRVFGDEAGGGLGDAAERVHVVRALGRHREHRDHAQAEQREADGDERHAVRQLHHRAVAAAQAEPVQRGGEAVGTAIQRRERHACAAGDERGARAMVGGPAAQMIAERQVGGGHVGRGTRVVSD